MHDVPCQGLCKSCRTLVRCSPTSIMHAVLYRAEFPNARCIIFDSLHFCWTKQNLSWEIQNQKSIIRIYLIFCKVKRSGMRAGVWLQKLILSRTGLGYCMMRSWQGLCKFCRTLVSNLRQAIMYVTLYRIVKRQMDRKGRDCGLHHIVMDITKHEQGNLYYNRHPLRFF